jgi:hypothetical protein
VAASVDVTVTFVNAAGADAAHTSAVPRWAVVRRTSDHDNPAPDTVAVCDPAVVEPSDRTNANSQRPAPAVLNAAVVWFPSPFTLTVTSTVGGEAVPGVTALDGADGEPVPIAFVAVTVNVYAVPLVSPPTVVLVAGGLPDTVTGVCGVAPTNGVTV